MHSGVILLQQAVLYCILHKKEKSSVFVLQLIVPNSLKKFIYEKIYNSVVECHLCIC